MNHGLPEYLQHDLDMYKEGLRTNSNLLDCYWGELYGSTTVQKLMMEQLHQIMQII